MKATLEPMETILSGGNPTAAWEAMIASAVANRVSDIHACAQREGYELAFRIDGILRPQGTFSHEFGRRLIGHVKSVAGIDLAESRRPTEGRLKIQMDGRCVDLRLSIVPTLHGQDIVVRLFDSTISLMDLAQLGFYGPQIETVRDAIQRPSGLILVSGPSGGGKTTTLYAMLRELAGRGRKIVTIEDPIEYDIDAVNQTQVNPRIGVTFARMLTAIMRQDPDIIMIGEIRDEETAVTAVRAANTGHLVLASTHATRSSRAVETLLSLGAHPYFLAVALRCIVSQVLVRRICPACKTPLPETAEMIMEDQVLWSLPEGARPQLYQGLGCPQCRNTGYQGRRGLFEVLAVDDQAKRMIAEKRSSGELDAAATAAGMLTLEQAGKLAAVTGETTLEEAIDILPMD